MRRAGACYVFGVIPLGRILPAGVDATPLAPAVQALVTGGVAALVGRVVLDDWTGENPSDPEWLVPRLRAHDHVLTIVAASLPVIPFRFGVVHSSRAAMAGSLACRTGELAAALRRLGPSQEWTVAIAARPPAPQAPGTSPGRSYLLTRSVELTARTWADAALAEVVGRCRDWHIPTTPLPPAADGTGRVACLIPRTAAGDVVARLQSLTGESIGVSVLGPFPPYHFVEPVR